jgi:hypothetical protein
MRGVRGVDDLKLPHRVAKTRAFQLFLHIRLAPDDQRLAQPLPLIGDGGAQDAGIVALGEDHPRLRVAGAGGRSPAGWNWSGPSARFSAWL